MSKASLMIKKDIITSSSEQEQTSHEITDLTQVESDMNSKTPANIEVDFEAKEVFLKELSPEKEIAGQDLADEEKLVAEQVELPKEEIQQEDSLEMDSTRLSLETLSDNDKVVEQAEVSVENPVAEQAEVSVENPVAEQAEVSVENPVAEQAEVSVEN
ncbi:MAG: hypothetical protein ACI8RA_001301, partial [Chlamydiales bacterium]